MRYTFRKTNLFNQPLDNWDVYSVAEMEGIFEGAVAFDQSLDNWNLKNLGTKGGPTKVYPSANQIWVAKIMPKLLMVGLPTPIRPQMFILMQRDSSTR